MTARILVVDDIEANRRLMQAKLEAKYYTVMLAENGLEALQIAEREQPHIILLDVMMPGMDGYEVCRRLKANVRTRHIPVVMLTALTDQDDRLQGLEVGADDFLSKPIEDFALMARIEAISHYNAVANELRTRGAAGHAQDTLTDHELETLSEPASILIIDEDDIEAQRLAVSLRQFGHKAETWLESRATGKVLPDVDLIILAFSGQSHDTLRLCAQLRSIEKSRNYSLIITCDKQDHEKALEALRMGAMDLLLNPVDAQELQARVRTQVRRQRYIDILRKRVDRGLELSIIDQLTGLYNRRHMLEQMQLLMRRAQTGDTPLSVVSLDIDHFKAVNDSYGHEAGDEILLEFAERLLMNIRPTDVACRVGGEEFLVIMPNTPGDLACVSAERIRQAIAVSPFRHVRSGEEIEVTVSAGVATYNGVDDVLADVLHRADEALYSAKQNGRNRIESRAA